jgi:VWFA-related protein
MAAIRSSLAILLICLNNFAQEALVPAGVPQRTPDFSIHIDVDLVQVDATVTDAQGRPVSDLKPEDFEILQDNTPQKITHFSFVAAPASRNPQPVAGAGTSGGIEPPAPVSGLKPEQVQHAVALVVDDLGLSFESMAYVRNALKRFVDKEMQPGDLAAVVRTGAGMGALQQFTADKRVLNTEIDGVKTNFMARVGRLQVDSPSWGEYPCPLENISASLNGIRYVVEALQELPGRKTVILFSENMHVFPDLPKGQPAPVARNAEPPPGEFPDVPCDYEHVTRSLRHLTDAAQRASVVIYTIDPRGVQPLQFTAADNVGGGPGAGLPQQLMQMRQDYRGSQEGLQYLAQETGGTFATHNDIAGAVHEAVADSQSYYLIGYRPPLGSFDAKTARWKFHTIKVRLKRPGLQVRSRSGFFGFPGRTPEQSPLTREAKVAHALVSPFAASDIHLRLTTVFSSHSKSMLSALLYIPGKELTFSREPDDTYKATLDAVAFTFDADGQAVNSSEKTYTIVVSPHDYEVAAKNGFILRLHHTVLPGSYQFRAVVRDGGSGKIGSAMQSIDVPDLKRRHLALSGIVLKQDIASTPSAENAEGQAPVLDPDGNEAVRIFRPGEPVRWAYQILNARTGHGKQTNVTVQARLWHQDRQVYADTPSALHWAEEKESGGMAAVGHMRLGAALEPGDYVLQVLVTDGLARKFGTASQSIDFEVK